MEETPGTRTILGNFASNTIPLEEGITRTISVPLQIEWNPKEDITVFELALCLKYHGRQIHHFELIDERVKRHFKITDHNTQKKD